MMMIKVNLLIFRTIDIENLLLDRFAVTELQWSERDDILTLQKPKKIEDLLEKIRACIKLGKYRDTTHAIVRQQQRKIILPEMIYVLTTGRHEKSKDRIDEAYNTWNYAVRGFTLEGKDLRIIVSFDEERDLLIITAFYIERRN